MEPGTHSVFLKDSDSGFEPDACLGFRVEGVGFRGSRFGASSLDQPTIGALVIGIGFWGPLYYNSKEPPQIV